MEIRLKKAKAKVIKIKQELLGSHRRRVKGERGEVRKG
jgi:hypothetical protein